MLDFNTPLDDATNLHAGAEAAYAAARLYNGEPMLPLETVQGQLTEQVRMPYSVGQTVSVRVWRGANQVVAAFGGLSVVRDCTEFIAGSGQMVQSQGIAGKINGMSHRWSNVVYSMVRDQCIQGITQVWLFGHSMGATQAMICAKGIKALFPGKQVGVVSYGSPNWCNFEAANDLGDLCYARVANVGDPVPFCMPTVDDGPLLYASLPALFVTDIASHVHLPRGVNLDANGNLTPNDKPQGLFAAFNYSLANVRLALGGAWEAHGIVTYIDRLSRAAAKPAAAHQPLHNAPQVLPAARRPPVVPRAEIVRAARRQEVFENRLPQEPFVQAGTGRVRVRKVDGQSIVFIDDRGMYFAENHRDAIAVAKACRRMMTQYVQNPDRFIGPGSLDELFIGAFGQGVVEDADV